MDTIKFAKMFNDKHSLNLSKMQYKYPDDFNEYLKTLNALFYQSIPLKDAKGNDLVYLPTKAHINTKTFKLLFKQQSSLYANKSLEEEIISTSKIENIDFDRKSVRNIMKGLAPKDEQENRILGLKKGYEFITDINNKIDEKNIYKLYMMSIGNFLDAENQLKKNNLYRHDSVFVVGSEIEHIGIDYKLLPTLMKELVTFINKNDDMDDLVKASIIHFYIADLHPYFDGNGRMARFLQMWYLIQQGYKSTLFVSFSNYIEKSRSKYYDAYSRSESNQTILGKLDVTPFIIYTIENIYDKLDESYLDNDTFNLYEEANKNGLITLKEDKLWKFILSNYGDTAFTTKQLEKDYGDVAYATIYNFVLKLSKLGLLDYKKLGNKVLYKIK